MCSARAVETLGGPPPGPPGTSCRDRNSLARRWRAAASSDPSAPSFCERGGSPPLHTFPPRSRRQGNADLQVGTAPPQAGRRDGPSRAHTAGDRKGTPTSRSAQSRRRRGGGTDPPEHRRRATARERRSPDRHSPPQAGRRDGPVSGRRKCPTLGIENVPLFRKQPRLTRARLHCVASSSGSGFFLAGAWWSDRASSPRFRIR